MLHKSKIVLSLNNVVCQPCDIEISLKYTAVHLFAYSIRIRVNASEAVDDRRLEGSMPQRVVKCNCSGSILLHITTYWDSLAGDTISRRGDQTMKFKSMIIHV